jgi:hypothetical protein
LVTANKVQPQKITKADEMASKLLFNKNDATIPNNMKKNPKT